MSLIMYDAIHLASFAGITNADAFAGYVDGRWPTFPLLDALAPPGTHLLSIAVFAIDNADCLDIETGDATNAQAPEWVSRQLHAGASRPCLYTSASNVGALVTAMRGFSRSQYRIWSAHYSGKHTCGPASCGAAPVPCDGTQWTDASHGRSLDESVLADDFFGSDPPPAVTSQEIEMFPITTGQDAVTPVPIPNGCKRVRFFTNGAADLHIDMMSAGTDLDLHTGYDNVQGFAVPSGCQAVVVRRTDAGTSQVNACYSF